MALLPVAAAMTLLALAHPVRGASDGLARTPPMGWRSWNAFGFGVAQRDMELAADAMAQPRDASGAPARHGESFRSLGYADAGLDDAWQACGAGVSGSFHDSAGRPLFNASRFPDPAGMVRHIHRRGLQAGWYHNNCMCRELSDAPWPALAHVRGDAGATVELGFDSVKLDDCGAWRDLDQWYGAFANASMSRGRPANAVMIENCHWGLQSPTLEWCPFHLFRTSQDISAHWWSMFYNLQTTRAFQGEQPLSRPGCWAYPDMLEVGNLASAAEDRAHFGAWAVTSSPLILGHNITDQATNERVWPIVSNKRAIAINQAWAGHPGRHIAQRLGHSLLPVQAWAKPLPGGALAVLLINDNSAAHEDELAVPLRVLGLDPVAQFAVLDVWTGLRQDALAANGTLFMSARGHDSMFLRLDPQTQQQQQL
jgi:alpha-galactosidase